MLPFTLINFPHTLLLSSFVFRRLPSYGSSLRVYLQRGTTRGKDYSGPSICRPLLLGSEGIMYGSRAHLSSVEAPGMWTPLSYRTLRTHCEVYRCGNALLFQQVSRSMRNTIIRIDSSKELCDVASFVNLVPLLEKALCEAFS